VDSGKENTSSSGELVKPITGSKEGEAALSSSKATAARYVLGICALLVTSYSLFTFLQPLFFLILITLPTALALVPLFFARLLARRGYFYWAAFLRSFMAPFAFALFFVLSGELVLAAYYGSPAVGLVSSLFLAIVFSIGAMLLHIFSSNASKNFAQHQSTSLFFDRVAGALALLFIFALVSPFAPVSWLGYPFLYSGIAYGALSISPLLASSSSRWPSLREAGLYLMHSTGEWSTVAFLVGFAAGILSLTLASVYTFVAILIIAVLGISYVGIKVYSLDMKRIETMQQQLYEKHSNEMKLVTNQDFDYINKAAREFVVTGRKGNLLVALSSILANAGVNFAGSKVVLEKLINYEIPPIYKFSDISLKKGLEIEMKTRMEIVNSTIAEMIRRVNEKG
jgi:hypothetical protein